jgi:hypothetical protein
LPAATPLIVISGRSPVPGLRTRQRKPCKGREQKSG